MQKGMAGQPQVTEGVSGEAPGLGNAGAHVATHQVNKQIAMRWPYHLALHSLSRSRAPHYGIYSGIVYSPHQRPWTMYICMYVLQ